MTSFVIENGKGAHIPEKWKTKAKEKQLIWSLIAVEDISRAADKEHAPLIKEPGTTAYTVK